MKVSSSELNYLFQLALDASEDRPEKSFVVPGSTQFNIKRVVCNHKKKIPLTEGWVMAEQKADCFVLLWLGSSSGCWQFFL